MRYFLTRACLVFAATALFAGCVASGDAVIIESKRKPVDPSVVEIYIQPPARYEPIGQISAACGSGLTRESSRDYAMEELKAQAAKIGANAILSVKTDEGTLEKKSITRVSVSGHAVYVPPSAMSLEHIQKLKKHESDRRRSKSLFQAIAGKQPEPPGEEIQERKTAAAPISVTPPAVTPAGSTELFSVLIENAALAYESGDYLSAAVQYEKAVRMNWNDPHVNYNLATVYFQLGNYPGAKTYYQTASYLSPSDPDAHLFLGQTYLHLKDVPAAIREWKKVLELDPANTAARESLESVGAEK